MANDIASKSLLSATTERIDCVTPEDLLTKLSPLDGVWQPDPSRWMFRGQSDASWPLKAKAHRDAEDVARKFGVVLDSPTAGTPQWSVDADRLIALLSRFRHALDAAGLAIPIPSPEVDLVASKVMHMGDPPEGSFPLIALAQHLGLPTPWLDWTQSVRVAAYFACVEAAEAKKTKVPDNHSAKQSQIVVWAIRRDFVVAAEHRKANSTEMTLVTAPRSSNVRLHAQGGVFTWLRGENAHATSVDEHVECLVDEYPDWLSPTKFDGPPIRSYCLPSGAAPKLLRLLSYEGVTGASVFPGYEGVVRGMKERLFWDKNS